MKNIRRRPLELYVHIPFCVRKCQYCDFLSGPSDEETKERYIEALLQEIHAVEHTEDYEIVSVFIGGGTPSALKAEAIASVMRTLQEKFFFCEDAEVTIEANPGTVDSEKLMTYRNAGINRLSLGLQSTDAEELKMLGRIHSYEEFLQSYQWAREAGFSNINIDLMFAIPGQTGEAWRAHLRQVAELKPEHISAYSLIIEEGTPFAECELDLPDEDTEYQMYEDTAGILAEYGYQQYEISNYAKAGYECKHNLKYWDRTDYIGFGIGAASLCNHKRYTNISDINNYIKALCVEYADNKESNKECIVENIKNIQETLKNSLEINNNCQDLKENIEVLTLEDEMAEYMFLGLRKSAGIDICDFKDIFGKDIYSVYKEQIKDNIAKGLLWQNGTRIALTDRGIDISNTVMSDFV